MNELKNFYKDKTILVTGGVGSIGSEIVKKVLEFEPKSVRVLDINETGLFDLEHELNNKKVRSFIGDVRDKNRLKRAIEGVDIVFHAAALKHVPLCEYNPFEAVKTNVIGTQNLIDVAIDEEVEKFITISTDKAVNPINVMGATKLLTERLTISANYYKGNRKTVFSCVRFGNVMGSRGSVIPLFINQIKEKKRVTLTNPNMTRFVMSISHAVKLVLRSCKMATGGEIFVLKMPVVRIGDLTKALINEIAPKFGYTPEEIKTDTIGKRIGEKDHEELLTEDEAKNAYENDTMFVILSSGHENIFPLKGFKKSKVKKYSSDSSANLTQDEIREMLKEIM